jgi:protoporphyrinogen oxidase
MKLGLDWSWQDLEWKDQYTINGTNIIDGAFLFEQNSYIPGTLLCISFQNQKPVNLGRGGAILLDNEKDAEILRLMSHDGRDDNIPWREQNIKYVGYHYYMTPESAQEGSKKLAEAKIKQHKHWDWSDYPDISQMEVFNGIN